MNDLQTADGLNTRGTEAGRKRALGTVFAELVLTLSLIVAIVTVLTIAGASGALAATRSDIIMMEESSSAFTTMGILSVIAVVMGILTVLALRDVAPVHTKRNNRRR